MVELHYLPLQSLARRGPKGLEFLVERKKVVQLVKAGDLYQLRENPPPNPEGLLGIGDVDGSLPGAAEEVRALSALYPGSKVFIGKDATLESLRQALGTADLLHLATHAELSTTNPNHSYIQLAAGARFKATDIFGLPLEGIRLVTLSGCETALGDALPGSDITSLAEAFWAAGAPTVVASLWKVDDASTTIFMVRAYRALREGKDVATAFQHAQLALLSHPEYRHPFYWAPFVVYGDWRSQ